MDSADRKRRTSTYVDTLPGLGPRIGLERLEGQAKMGQLLRASGGMARVLQAQVERFEWFVERGRLAADLDELIALLEDERPRPGQREQALVTLCLRADPPARAYLAHWQPPEHDEALRYFYRICVAHAGLVR